MKQAGYFRVPEGQADLEQLWREAEPIEPAKLPAWLEPEYAGAFRYLGRASTAGLPADRKAAYRAELNRLRAAGLIVEAETGGHSAHRIYIGAPTPQEVWGLPTEVWSIGIYVGGSPFAFGPGHTVANPVITREDISDVVALYVADPFMVRANDTWYMFFEVMNWRAGKGEIGLATSSNATDWVYRQVVLSDTVHLSYPYLFRFDSGYYMIPESAGWGCVRLYKAIDFPTKWSPVGNLLTGPYLVDASIFRFRGRWWLFAETNENKHDTLRLYHSEDLMGPWLEHPMSPVVAGDARLARHAGRVLVRDDLVVRYAQDCYPSYGTAVRAFQITELSATTYREREVEQSPILGPSGSGWNAGGMHHIDPHPLPGGGWIACVDGRTRGGQGRADAAERSARASRELSH